jgi:hypothetical protein
MTMKAVVTMILGLMLSSGLAYAADTSPSSPTTGHPAVLTDTECNGVWMDAAGGADVLAGDKAGGYVTDFKQADANQDGNISQAEFKEACKKGLIKAEHAESAKMGKDVGTHAGTVGEKPALDTSKIVQPPRKSPATGGDND